MDPATIAMILASLQTGTGLAGLFRKKPSYPDYIPLNTDARLAAIKQKIGDNQTQSLGTLNAGAIRRGFGRSGQMGQIARDVTIAGNKDYNNAATDLQTQEADRYQNYLLGKYGAQNANYGAESGGYGSMLGNGTDQLLQLLSRWGQGGGGDGGQAGLGIKPATMSRYFR